MSDDLVKRAREALDGVTPGPWVWETETSDWPEHYLVDVNGDTVMWFDFDLGFRFSSDAAKELIASSRELVHAMADRIEELEAKLAKAVDALGAWTVLLDHCSIEEGVCCCGEDMEGHSHPMNCGHSPVDHGAYVATNLYERTRAVLAEISGGDNE